MLRNTLLSLKSADSRNWIYFFYFQDLAKYVKIMGGGAQTFA